MKHFCRFTFALLLFTSTNTLAKDRYQNFEELSREKREGHDYQIKVKNNQSTVTVFAIHGGKIEPGTSELAKKIANKDMNLYLFEGLQKENNFADLHITSTRFNEPHALTLAEASSLCVSLHSYWEDKLEGICVGGASEIEASKMAESLSKNLSIPIEYPCKKFPGKEPRNIVNRCQNAGVQIELSSFLLEKLSIDKSRAKKIAKTIRETILSSVEK